MELLQHTYPDAGQKRLLNWQARLWAFLRTISVGDLAVLPLKTTSAVATGKVEPRPPPFTAARRTPATQSHQYRLPHTPLPYT